MLGSNDGVVVSRSEEAKKLGVPMGVPHFKVKDLFHKHKVAIFSSNFELYQDISNRVIAVMKDELTEVHQYSIDEAFFELTVRDIKMAEQRLRNLKIKIEQLVGIPVSLGAGKTMTIAKYASEKEKRKSGICVLADDVWKDLTKEIPIGDIWGVGGKTTAKLRDHKILTVLDLLSAPEIFVSKEFGVHGLRLLSELDEKPAHKPEERVGIQKSIMSTRSFSKNTTSLTDLETAISYHVGRAAKELREINGKAMLINVQLLTSRHGDWFMKSVREDVYLPTPTSDTRTLLKYAIALTRKLYQKDVPYKKAGIILSHITEANLETASLWKDEKNNDSTDLMNAVDEMNEKLGKDVITFGRIKNSGRLDRDKYRSPRYTTDWNELKKISFN